MSPEPSLLNKLLSGAAQATGDARDRIVATAIDQVSDFGVRRFTVDELAKRVGLSRVTIYRHFTSKEQVLEAALLSEVRRFMSEVDAAVAPFDTVEDRAVEGVVFAVGHLREHAPLQRLLRTEPELILPLLTTRGGPVLEIGREVIAGFTRGADTPMSSRDLQILSELLARLILSLVLMPDSAAPLETEAQLRAYSQRYVAGVVRSFIGESLPAAR